MSFYDWDNDGDKDFVDDFIEYQIYQDCTDFNNNTSYNGGGISTIGAIIATVGGLFLSAAILALLGCGENTPVLFIIILWIICGAVLANWFDKIGF